MQKKYDLITIVGPTATGKTSLAVAVGSSLGAEIISADSRQLFRGMDLGTGKDIEDYTLPDGTSLPYHLIDIKDPGEPYSLYHYSQDFRRCLQELDRQGKTALLVGGTGMYVEHVLKGESLQEVSPNAELRKDLKGLTKSDLLDILRRYSHFRPQGVDLSSERRIARAIEVAAYRELHPESHPTPTASPLSGPIICLVAEKELRWQRIGKRLRERLEWGMVDEVRGLLQKGVPYEVLWGYGLEYRYLSEYIMGKLSYEEMFTQLNIAIRQFSKRQMTWFRGMIKRGFDLYFIDASLPKEIQKEEALRYIHSFSQE